MREKIIDEAVGVFFIFGGHPVTGNVDISNGEADVFVNLPRTVAERIIAAQSKFRAELYEILKD